MWKRQKSPKVYLKPFRYIKSCRTTTVSGSEEMRKKLWKAPDRMDEQKEGTTNE